MRNAMAVILAGGKGERMGIFVPEQTWNVRFQLWGTVCRAFLLFRRYGRKSQLLAGFVL